MTLRVWINNKPVGRLDKFGRGTTFVYDVGVDPNNAISLTMPVRTASYDSTHGLLPVFDTNLPEGTLRERIETGLRKARGQVDALDILELTGCNQVGRIKVLPEGETPERRAGIGDINEILDREASRTLINEVMARYATRSGVSGAMPKVLVETDGDPMTRPEGSLRHTLQTRDYILKFDDDDYPGLSLNEYHCLQATRAGGNEVAEARLNVDGHMLSVSRFDERNGARCGFEDLAALNAKISEDKYTGSIESNLFKRVVEFSGSAEQENLEALYRLCVTNIALRNGDAHLKNFAMLYEDTHDGPVTLSPAYDLVTTTAYLEADLMALSLNGSKRWPKPGTVLQLGARAKLSRQQAQAIINEVGAGLRQAMPAMLEDFTSRGMEELGGRIAAAWNQGLEYSLGVEPIDLNGTSNPESEENNHTAMNRLTHNSIAPKHDPIQQREARPRLPERIRTSGKNGTMKVVKPMKPGDRGLDGIDTATNTPITVEHTGLDF